ncbi:hypothetical protein LSTR_LSTR002614 [Laodelphax striatellus]|uniref:Sialin n=1 Tax=Laodelphax striatellus TaxID=195883 RepID=A0A482XNC5_LAOST|nr:hypothetical protein LSTR_LSTR002614 [Laodelphax striatellus]
MPPKRKDSWKEKVSKGCLPQRYVLGIMGFLAVANAYSMRNTLNLAITQMVEPHYRKNHTLSIDDPEACPGEIITHNHTIYENEQFDWSEKMQGYILSAFYWGYVITHIPGGILAEKFGGKHVLGLGLFSTAVLTLLIPLAARAGPMWLIALRFIQGLGEGTTFPALNALLATWTPPMERGRMGSLVFKGNQIGIVMSSIVCGLLLKYLEGQWAIVFYLFGFLGIIWYVIWCFTCYSDPASHPYISQEEREFLTEKIGALKRKENLPPVPWLKMATSVPLWALIIAQIGHDWGLFTIQTDLPKYMSSVMKFSIAQNGFFSAMPFLVMWVTAIFAGFLSDFLIKNKILRIGTTRKLFNSVASVGPAAGAVAASYAGCDKLLVAGLFTVGMAFMGFFYPSLKVNALDLSPNYAGTLMAFVNGIGAISGIITPTLIGYLITENTIQQWRQVFWVSGSVIVITNGLYIFLGSAKVQPWNDLRKIDEEEVVSWKAKSGTSVNKV